MRVKAILWTYHKNKENTYPIKIRISHKNRVEYLPLNSLIKKEHWDAKSCRVKIDKVTNGAEINMKIIELLASLESNFIKDGIINPEKPVDDFYYYFQKRIDYIEQKYSYYHFRKHKGYLAELKKFSPQLPIKKLTLDFLHSYEKHLIEIKNHPNTIHDKFLRMRVIVSGLVKSGIIPYHKNPFINFKVEKVRTDKKRLSYEDIQKLENAILARSRELARDMYIFSFYCGGIRFGDLCRLKHSMIKEGRLMLSYHKKNNLMSILLAKQAIDILEKYKGTGYIFETKIDWNEELKSINSRNVFFNKKLKGACKVAEIEEITFHTSRHSIADYAINNDLTDIELQQILGHSSAKSTAIYKKSFYQEVTDAAMKKLFDK